MIGHACWALTVPLLIGAMQESPAWPRFTSQFGKFSVAMPATPTESRQRVKTATGQLEVTLFVAEGRKGMAYVVSYSDYPADDVKPGTEDRRLDFARDGAVASARGTLRAEKRITVDGHPARDVVIAGKDETVIRLRLVVAGQRLFQVMAVGPASPAAGKEVTAFLDSFRPVK